jgi:excisionase family DNA binding protein
MPRLIVGCEWVLMENESRQSRPAEVSVRLVSVGEAAKFLAVSVSTLYGWVWQRRISFVKLGRSVRFDMADLKRFVEENRIHARTERKF